MANSKWQIANGKQRIAIFGLLFAVCYLLSACALPGDAAPVVKIGVIAPFEGAGRPLGYAILPAIKAAVTEANASGKLGRYQVLVVAFNDDLHGSTAADQARALALDPEVLAVVGPWSVETVAAAEPILVAAGLPVLASAGTPAPPPGEKWGTRPWLMSRHSPATIPACCSMRLLPTSVRTAGRRAGGVGTSLK